MPVYEFYCSDCHVIFNFISSRVDTGKRPDCPKCGKPGLDRKVSRFAVSRGLKEEPIPGMPDLDEDRMEKAMMAMASEMEGMDENDPRQMARIMRKISEVTGLNLGDGVEEAIHRLEAGEDPDKIEEEMGDIFDDENPFAQGGMKGLKKRFCAPAHDETLYRLD
jgi:putative FmdB family regulatory protein